MRKFVIRNICDCSRGDQDRLLQIRNSDSVRREMYSDCIISTQEHARYIDSLRGNPSRVLFAILCEKSNVVGALSLSEIDRIHKNCDWAFYLDSSARGGVGSAVEFFILDYVFNEIRFSKLNCEVIETNPMIVNMHKKFGFVEEGFRRENIIKNGRRVGVHLLGITRGEWHATRLDVLARLSYKSQEINIFLEQGIEP